MHFAFPPYLPQLAEPPAAVVDGLSSSSSPASTGSPAFDAPPTLPWRALSGQGVGFGLDFFGVASADTDLGLQLSVLLPLGRFFAVRDRIVLYDGSGADGGVALGDRLEFVVRSTVLLNFVRVYAGAGPAVFYGLSGPSARQVDGNWFAGNIDGDWFVGFEVFFSSALAVHWETGTSGGAFDTGAGPYVDVGLSVYPF